MKIRLVYGDMNNFINERSIDYVITDPPYSTKTLKHHYNDLNSFCKRNDVKCLITVVNHLKLEYNLECLTYYKHKIPIILQLSRPTLLNYFKQINRIKMIMVCFNNINDLYPKWHPNIIKMDSPYRKSFEWEQGNDITKFVMAYFDLSNKVLCDPYAGVGGMFKELLKSEAKEIIAIEKDQERYNMLLDNIKYFL